MAMAVVPGQRTWSMAMDDEGHREYKAKWRVAGLSTDGPSAARVAVGLPAFGSPWVLDGENDPWAWCRHAASVVPVVEGEPNTQFDVELTFSSKPPDNKSCSDQQVTDPLLQPPKVSGSFTKRKEEATRDRFGSLIHNSAYEQMRGHTVEFDKSTPSVKVEMNVAALDLASLAATIETVNAFPLWGCAPRCVKLSGVSWERKYHGLCAVYYTETLDFEVCAETFDRDLLDEGTKVLHGHWRTTDGAWVLDPIGGFPPDPTNPQHFDRFKDRNGENCRVVLSGGLPVGVSIGTGTGTASGSVVATPGTVRVEYYPESDFLLLGVPSSF